MSKFGGAMIFGAILGASLVFALMTGTRDPDRPVSLTRDILVFPDIPESDVDALREQRFAALDSIEDIVSLPTAFSRAEALHALAGRSSPDRVQRLIYDAARIRDDAERDSALQILFTRLADADPKTAVAMSRLAEFSSGNRLESQVWQYWSRKNFDAALAAADRINEPRQRRVAAQALFAANGFYATPEVEEIQARLGIRPDRTNQVRHINQLMDASPDAAVKLVNDMPYGLEKQQLLSGVAGYLASIDADRAQAFVSRITDQAARMTLENMLASLDARSRPAETLKDLLETRGNPNDGRLYSAAQSLAASDLDRALQFYADAETPAQKSMIGMAVAQEYAKRDPDAALRWARESRGGDNLRFGPGGDLLTAVIGTIARDDPERAMVEIKSQPKSQRRDQLMQQVVMQVSMSNPARAMEMIDQVEVSNYQMSSRSTAFNMWAQTDPRGAANWLAANSEKFKPIEMSRLAATLANADVDLAMQLLPQMDDSNAGPMRRQIAQQLVARGSIEEATRFIERFRNSDDHGAMQLSLIQGVAQADPLRAEQLAQQLPAGKERDGAYASLVYAASARSPADAVRLLDQISDQALRQQSGSLMLRSWASSDPAEAVDWLLSRPSNEERDQMLVQLASNLGASNIDPRRVLRAMSSPEQRSRAETNYIIGLAQHDPARARTALASSSLDDDTRQSVLGVIERYEKGALGSYGSSFPVVDY